MKTKRQVEVFSAGCPCCEEAVKLDSRLVKQAGGRPALRAAHDGGVAVQAADAFDLARDQIERLVP